MTNEDMLREFSALPPEGQRIVAEIVSALRQRYANQQSAPQPESVNLLTEPFIGMWKDREEMADSVEWVRNLREQEWGIRHGADPH